MKIFFTLVFIAVFIQITIAGQKPQTKKVPTQLSVEIVNSTSAKLSWIGNLDDYSYRLRIRPIGVLTWKYYYVEAPTNMRRVMDLQPGTKYQWQVQTQFSKSSKDTSIFVDGPNFTPWEKCDAPNGLLAVTGEFGRSVALVWLPTGTDVSYSVSVRESEAKEWTTYHTNRNLLLLNELPEGTGYDWRVRAFCGPDQLESAFSETSYFALQNGNVVSNEIGIPGNIKMVEAWQLLTFDVQDADGPASALIQDHMGRKVGELPVFYTSSSGKIAFKISETLPPGLYSVAYQNAGKTVTKTVMVGGD